MTNPYEWLIGTRYLRSTHRRGFVSFVALISTLGLTLGVAVLIVVLSVMNGFERELRSRMLSVTSHATILGLQGPLENWRETQAGALKHPGVLAAVPFIEAQAMVAHGQSVLGTTVRGVLPDEEQRADGLAQRLKTGRIDDLQAGRFRAILGSALAHDLGAKVGDKVVFMAPEGTATPIGIIPRQRTFKVSGIFESGMYEFDRGLALVHMSDAALLYRLGTGATGIRLALEDPLSARRTVSEVALSLGGPGFFVSDWTRNHANFFRSIEIAKSLLFIILLLIVGVAAFNIVATLVMIVKEKQTDIAILRTLGAGPRNVLIVFAIQGVLIGLLGTALGTGLGILISHNLQSLVHGLETLLNTKLVDARVYNMSDLPAYVEWGDVLQICSVAFLLCAVATIYPSWRASRTAPAEALRHD